MKMILFTAVLILISQVIFSKEAQALPACTGIDVVYNVKHTDSEEKDQHCPKVRVWNQNQDPNDPYDDWISRGKMCYMTHRVVGRALCCWQSCGGISPEAYCIPHCDDKNKPFVGTVWGCGAGSWVTLVYEEWDMENLTDFHRGINEERVCNACSCFCDEPLELCICNNIARKTYVYDNCYYKPNCP